MTQTVADVLIQVNLEHEPQCEAFLDEACTIPCPNVAQWRLRVDISQCTCTDKCDALLSCDRCKNDETLKLLSGKYVYTCRNCDAPIRIWFEPL